ncbi:MAG: Ig-like domain-containing protein [Promethearchaeota archaeon]
MRVNKNKKFIAIIASLAILNTISMVVLYDITNVPDNIRPVITIKNPTQAQSLSGTVTISFTASDRQIITEKQILIDGIIVQTAFYSYTWDTTQEIDGSHRILCRAKDKTIWGNDEITVITNNNNEDIDSTPPNVVIISPTVGSTLSGLVTITMDANDTSGIRSYAIYIDSIFISGTKSYSWDTIQENDGLHTILCEATDPFDNTGSDTISITVNNSVVPQDPSKIFKLMTFNINTSGFDPDWKEVVKEENADIIMFIETGNWDDNSNEKLNQYVSEFNTYFTDEDPYIGYCTQGISYLTDGTAIMSRYPIVGYNQITHVTLDNSSSYDVTHDFFDVEVNISGVLIHVIGSHLKSLPGAENEQMREWEQEGIINYLDSLGSVPIAYLGDMNSFSPEDWGLNTIQSGLGYGPLSMMVSPYSNPDTGGDYSSYASTIHSWTDVHRTLNPSDWGVTYPSYSSRIDFIYINQFISFKIVNSTTGDTAHASTGSDHFSIDVYINLN